MSPRIAIVSIEGDMHALAVDHVLRRSQRATVHLLNVDRLSNTTAATWRYPIPKPVIKDVRGDDVPVDELDAIWWRRYRWEQKLDYTPAEEAHADLINNDWWAFFKGLLLTAHRGEWISHPEATERASLKIWQLQVAAECGFRVPRTLASNDPYEVRQFLSDLGCPAIVKPIMGTRLKQLFTQFVDIDRLDDDNIRIVPALYQEFIPGDMHLRANVFGWSVYAASIATSALDWRRNLDVPVSKYTVDPALEHRLIDALRTMDLAMGIVDLKLLPSGEPVWLEVNPQGQFLFLENLSHQNLLFKFADFLIERAARDSP
jgi:glutathione synthase/RimK-type ligase-like ATP-grasp enzyme